MRNKRKYDTPAPNAADITQKNLKKLKKLNKADDPRVAEIKAKAAEFLADRKNSNSLVDIIGHLDVSEPSSVAMVAINAIKGIVTSLTTRNQIKRPSETTEEESTELKYRRWLWERLEEAFKQITDLMFHRKSSVCHLAVSVLMSIIEMQNFSVDKPKPWDLEAMKILNLMVLSFCSNKTSNKIPLAKMLEFFVYCDVGYQFFATFSKVVSKVAKMEKGSAVFVDNVINILEAFSMPDKEKFESMPKFIAENEDMFLHDNLRKHYGLVWTSLVVCNFNVEQYKRSLIMLNEKVLPLLPKPVLMTDFLLGSFSTGGAISMLALSGVFTLMVNYNLDYPDFYKKLYELFRVEVFHVKYRARFFHLANMFLSSTHVPESLVASFAKRLARISLQAPAECLPLCIKFIHNLIFRHRGLEVMIDADINSEHDKLQSDPFLEDETDPYRTKALESSLWELHTLTSHLLPAVSSEANMLIEKGIREDEKDIADALENKAADMMEAELKKKVFVNVALNWEEPVGLKFKKDDFLSEVFDI